LAVFANDKLLNELEKNLQLSLLNKANSADIVMQAIKAATIYVTTIPKFNFSPDPKDNFLFDIALQTKSEVIVTQEKALLNFDTSPVLIHDIKWFKETYPVPL
jgi:uncharacterized protein